MGSLTDPALHTPLAAPRESSVTMILSLVLLCLGAGSGITQGRSSGQRSATHGNSLGCRVEPSLRITKYLDRICDDCYMLYRDHEIHQMCRSDCYSSTFFGVCLDVMMVSKETRRKAARLTKMINTFTSREWRREGKKPGIFIIY